MTKLLIVESPSKAKTLSKYLGSDYHVLASYGHIRNLLPKSEGVNTENFEMKYEVIDRNKKHIDAIIKAVKKSGCFDRILLSTVCLKISKIYKKYDEEIRFLGFKSKNYI